MWALAQKTDNTIMRATGYVNTNGTITIITQNGTSFRYFKVFILMPYGVQ